VPKQGSRTFPSLLRAFGIAGDVGRRLKFALGNDISPIVNADEYDPQPQSYVRHLTQALAGHRSFVEVVAPADRPIFIIMLWYQVSAFFTIAETLPPVGTGSRTGLTLTDDYSSSHGLPLQGSLNAGEYQTAPQPQFQFNAGAAQIFVKPLVIGPGRVFATYGNTNASHHINIIYYMPQETPPRA